MQYRKSIGIHHGRSSLKASCIFLILIGCNTFVDRIEAVTEREQTSTSSQLWNFFKSRNNTQTILYNESTVSANVVGGTPVTESTMTFPFYGFTRWGSLCGATLIHPDIAVSAGHCAGYFLRSGMFIGGFKFDGSDAKEAVRVLQEVRHPNYNEDTYENDILILKLQRTNASRSSAGATLTSSTRSSPAVQPVYALNYLASQPRVNATVVTIGYGATSEDGPISNTMRQVSIRVIGNTRCSELYRRNQALVASSMICASSPGKDACQGDSGGPLLIQTMDSQRRKQWKLVGIVSWGVGCARAQSPGVYTRISSYSDFIKRNVCSLSQYKPLYCS